MSPAYDLTYSSSFNGEHATTIDGEGKNPNLDNILSVAKNIGLKEKLAKDILDTKFGKDAYNFYKEETNNSQKAVEIYVKITSSILRQN